MMYHPPTTFFEQKLCWRVFLYLVTNLLLSRATTAATTAEKLGDNFFFYVDGSEKVNFGNVGQEHSSLA